MLGNFSYSNPTKLYFGEESLCSLNEELPKYGKTVQLIYGGGSIKKNGIYDQVMELLKSNGKVVIEDGGVMPNPTVEKLREGVRIARENHVDFLLAVGGGSCCDYAKAVSVSVHCDEDPWEKYYIRFEEPDCEIVPVGCVLTMVGTGSEMNGGAVITDHDQKLKIGHVFGDRQVVRNNSKNAHQLQVGGHSLTCTVLQAVDLSCSQPFCAQVQKPYLECVQRNLGPVSSLSHTCNGTAL